MALVTAPIWWVKPALLVGWFVGDWILGYAALIFAGLFAGFSSRTHRQALGACLVTAAILSLVISRLPWTNPIGMIFAAFLFFTFFLTVPALLTLAIRSFSKSY
jgi:hypothetical protein